MTRTKVHIHMRDARKKACLTQAQLADRLYVSERFISKVENGGIYDVGVGFVLDWFHACGVPLDSVYRSYAHPDIYDGVDSGSDIFAIRAALRHYIDIEASDNELRCLFFARNGNHGSSFPAWLQKGVADLQCPLQDRYNSVVLIETAYRRAKQLDRLVCPNDIQPILSMLQAAMDSSLQAIYSGREHYADTGRKSEDDMP